MKSCMRQLAGCCSALFAEHQGTLAVHSCRFASLSVALASTGLPWWTRLELHMMKELCEMSSGTRLAGDWTCRDDDCGGSLVSLGRCRGGPKQPSQVSSAVLRKLSKMEEVDCYEA